MIRILLVDDQATVRQGWRMRLALEADMDVVGEAASGADALQLARELVPDVVLIDLEMPGMDGVEAVRRLVAQRRSCVAVVMVSMYDSQENRRRARQAGAVAFVGKQQSTEILLAAIRRAATDS